MFFFCSWSARTDNKWKKKITSNNCTIMHNKNFNIIWDITQSLQEKLRKNIYILFKPDAFQLNQVFFCCCFFYKKKRYFQIEIGTFWQSLFMKCECGLVLSRNPTERIIHKKWIMNKNVNLATENYRVSKVIWSLIAVVQIKQHDDNQTIS